MRSKKKKVTHQPPKIRSKIMLRFKKSNMTKMTTMSLVS